MDLITRKESTRYPGLFVKKYKRKVFYDNLWSEYDELLEARGHVELADGTIVVRPFTKIFNRGENGTDIDRDETVIAVCKVNGFMACATYVPQVDQVIVSTTGSLDSDFVLMAEEYITDAVKKTIKMITCEDHPITFMFEIVHPNDPHIISEEPGAYLIGVRYVDETTPYFSNKLTEENLDYFASEEYLNVKRPHWCEVRFSDITDVMSEVRHEGFVVYGQDSKTALKIKSPYYLCLKAAARKKDIMTLNKQLVDEEFYDLIDHIKDHEYVFNELDEQERLTYIRNYLSQSRFSVT
jgi:hypothetical protein